MKLRAGTTAPALLNSTSNQLYLHFHSDISVVAAGFYLEYKSTHLQFLNFSSEANHDFLEIRKGPHHTSSLIGQFSGTEIPPSLLSTTHETVIHFYSDHSENRQGFKLKYQAYELQNCPKPHPFPNGYIINSDFNVGQSISFECYPGYALIGHPVLTCQHGINRNWNYPFPRCEAPCGYNVSAQNGTIYSPGFPNEYPHSKDCIWQIAVSHGHGIYINFTLLQTEPVNDYIAVWDGPGENYAQLGVFSGNTALQSAYSSFNQVLIKLHSDFSTGGFFVLNFHAYRLIKCQPPPVVLHSEILKEDEDFEIGDVVKYKCFPGFTLVGSDQLTCKLNTYLQFEGTLNSCEAQCPANEVRTESSGVILSPGYPGLYPNSQTCSWTVKVEFGYNISIYVEMFQSEKQFDELEIFDGPTGQSPLLVALSGNHTGQLNFTSKTNVLYLRWSTDHATNKKGFKIRYSAVSCGIPEPPGNGTFYSNQYTFGSKIQYQCNEGYRLEISSAATTVCQEDGRWSNKGIPPLCIPMRCPNIEAMLSEHVVWHVISGSSNEYGAQVLLSCSPGYYLEGRRTIQCLANGTWRGSEEQPTCKMISCGELSSPPNGNRIGTLTTYGATAIFTCNTGYTLTGSHVRECQDNGLWSGTDTRCLAITCGHPGNPTHGRTNGNELNLNDMVNFTCNTGYILQGASRAQCRASGQWSNPLPACRGEEPDEEARIREQEEVADEEAQIREQEEVAGMEAWCREAGS
ncbi:UNVERIFIED_CONTAM: hypothetical protein FKN15_016395 [Acipenser sinensis]